MHVAADVGCSFAARFFTLLASQQYADLGRMFLSEGDHASSLSIIDLAAGNIDVFTGSDIPDALSRVFACVAHKHVIIESVAAHQVYAGITAAIAFKDSESLVAGSVSVLLEHYDDESFFVRDASVQLVETVVAKQVQSVVEQVVEPEVEAVPEVAPEVAEVEVPVVEAVVEEAPAPVVVEEPIAVAEVPVEPVPVVTKSKKGKKGAKVVEAQAVVAPVEVAAETVVEQAPAVEEPVVATPAVVEAPVVVEEAPVAPAKPAGPKSWAALARAPPTANAAAPVKVTPPAKEVAAPAKEEPTKEAKAVAPRPAARPEVGDRLVFMTQSEVTDDEVKAALGAVAKNIVSLRNQSKNNRIFVDFVAGFAAFDKLKDKSITLKGSKITVQRQRQQ